MYPCQQSWKLETKLKTYTLSGGYCGDKGSVIDGVCCHDVSLEDRIPTKAGKWKQISQNGFIYRSIIHPSGRLEGKPCVGKPADSCRSRLRSCAVRTPRRSHRAAGPLLELPFDASSKDHIFDPQLSSQTLIPLERVAFTDRTWMQSVTPRVGMRSRRFKPQIVEKDEIK